MVQGRHSQHLWRIPVVDHAQEITILLIASSGICSLFFCCMRIAGLKLDPSTILGEALCAALHSPCSCYFDQVDHHRPIQADERRREEAAVAEIQVFCC